MHPALTYIAKNRPIQIAIIVIALFAIVFFVGKKKGKEEANAPSWWSKLFGGSEKAPAKTQNIILVNGTEPLEKVATVTDAIFTSFENHRFYSPNGNAINQAFGLFNILSFNGKASVINDWRTRYAGLDRPGLGTGNYTTIKQEIQTFDMDSLKPEVAIAYKWMQDNNIT